MKKYLLMGIAILVASFMLQSCLDDNDDYVNYGYFVSPIDSINMPDTANFGELIKIKTYTTLKDKCQAFYTFDYKSLDSVRIVSAVAIQYNDVKIVCGKEKTATPVLDFKPMHPGTYKFKFWTGKDTTTNKDTFIMKDIFIKHKK